MVRRVCPVCGAEFTSPYPAKKYCTKECWNEYRKSYQKEYQQKHADEIRKCKRLYMAKRRKELNRIASMYKAEEARKRISYEASVYREAQMADTLTAVPKIEVEGKETKVTEYRNRSINSIAKEIHDNAVKHGWWDESRSFGDIISLCHSELSEAVEAYRNAEPMVWGNDGKPDGIAVEMIDCVIRIFDYLAHEGIDIEETIGMKMDYNRNRPYRHGDKKM